MKHVKDIFAYVLMLVGIPYIGDNVLWISILASISFLAGLSLYTDKLFD